MARVLDLSSELAPLLKRFEDNAWRLLKTYIVVIVISIFIGAITYVIVYSWIASNIKLATELLNPFIILRRMFHDLSYVFVIIYSIELAIMAAVIYVLYKFADSYRSVLSWLNHNMDLIKDKVLLSISLDRVGEAYRDLKKLPVRILYIGILMLCLGYDMDVLIMAIIVSVNNILVSVLTGIAVVFIVLSIITLYFIYVLFDRVSWVYTDILGRGIAVLFILYYFVSGISFVASISSPITVLAVNILLFIIEVIFITLLYLLARFVKSTNKKLLIELSRSM
jgi:hypothetical protein